jgi:hypothetical protein
MKQEEYSILPNYIEFNVPEEKMILKGGDLCLKKFPVRIVYVYPYADTSLIYKC